MLEPTRELFDASDDVTPKYTSALGLSVDVVRKISEDKGEPSWMLDKRLSGLRLFEKSKMPSWGPSLSNLDIEKITYYARPDAKKNSNSWEDVPGDIKRTFDRLGIPEAEQQYLSGVGAQYDSEVVYHRLKDEWTDKGVVFLDMDEAVIQYPDLVKEHFMSRCVPISDHPFVMLHAAVWSGGTFIYVPKGVKLDIPLQAYFRMNQERGGQFEHTLIVIDEGAECHYIEGCSAPKYNDSALHAGCVEIFVKKNAKCRYSSVENWSKNTFNLNTKRAIVEEGGVMEWVGGNMGSGTTMLYPSSILIGDRSRADHVGVAFAGHEQNQDTGAKVIIIGKDCSATITSKSISKQGGICSYRGLVKIVAGARNAKVRVQCDGLIMDRTSVANAWPAIQVREPSANVAHEATVGSISADRVFYLMARGLDEQHAVQVIVNGFIDPIIRQLPLEYAVEMNKLVEMELEGAT